MGAPTNYSKITIGLPQTPEGVPPELFTPLFNVYQAVQNLRFFLSKFAGVDEYSSDLWSQLSLDDTLWPGNSKRWYVKQNEALNFGQAVSPINVAGVAQARLANATNNTRWACGFVSSNDHTVGVGNFCEVTIGDGLLLGVSGLAAGSRYWLNTVNGQITNVAPVAAGNIEQFVGWALAANRLAMHVSGEYVQH